MAWQYQDVGVTPTNANSVPKKDPIRIDYKTALTLTLTPALTRALRPINV